MRASFTPEGHSASLGPGFAAGGLGLALSGGEEEAPQYCNVRNDEVVRRGRSWPHLVVPRMAREADRYFSDASAYIFSVFCPAESV